MKKPLSRDQGYTPPSAMPDYLIRQATLRQLQVFEAIVRLGSFTRAAEELFLTQPTVSMQIKKLSEAMGLPLFEHVGRGNDPICQLTHKVPPPCAQKRARSAASPR